MLYRKFKDIEIPALGFGTFELQGEACSKAVADALEIGYTHLDTAEMYDNEEYVSKGIKQSGKNRDDLFITSKVWHDHLTEAGIKKALDQSLQKLDADYLDLYLIHWPSTTNVPLRESLNALRQAQEDGKIRNFGVSNFTPSLLKEALEFDIANIQVEYHPLLDQSELLQIVQENDITLTAYSPLAQGKVFKNPALKEIGEKHDRPINQVAIRWLLEQKNVITIPRSSNKEHIASNFEALYFGLDKDDKEKIAQLENNNRVVNPDFAPAWNK